MPNKTPDLTPCTLSPPCLDADLGDMDVSAIDVDELPSAASPAGDVVESYLERGFAVCALLQVRKHTCGGWWWCSSDAYPRLRSCDAQAKRFLKDVHEISDSRCRMYSPYGQRVSVGLCVFVHW